MEEQLFFILIILGLLGGYSLAYNRIIEKFEGLKQINFNDNPQLNLVFTISLLLIGLLTLCLPGNGQPFFIGDLIPALAVILSSKILAYKLYRAKYHKSEEQIEGTDQAPKNIFNKIEDIFEKVCINNQEIIGFIVIAIIVLHFFAQSIIFL